jgi:hypothetical protein
MSERGGWRACPSGHFCGRLALALALFGAVCGCSRSNPAGPSGATSAPMKSAATMSASARPAPAAPSALPSARPTKNRPEPAATTRVILEERGDAGLGSIHAGELADVGPGGPASAARDGVVLLTKDDRVLLAKRSPGSKPTSATLTSVDEAPAAFRLLAKPPSIASGFAYWVSQGRLVRRALGDGELESLRDDARPGTRVSAAEFGGTAAVAYIGQPDSEGTSHARLWLEGLPPLELTPEGAGASSVALTAHGDGLLAVAIDGRSAMTPVHARRITWQGRQPRLADDVVVWVAGSAQAFTEIVVGSSQGRAFAYLPTARDVSHFALASLDLGSEPRLDSEVTFFDYPNGIDLAPVASAELCGRPHVAFARPTTPAPGAPQELVLAEPGSGRMLNLANSRGFVSVSLAAQPGGALLAYVADGRTWARGLTCR